MSLDLLIRVNTDVSITFTCPHPFRVLLEAETVAAEPTRQSRTRNLGESIVLNDDPWEFKKDQENMSLKVPFVDIVLRALSIAVFIS